MEEGACALCPPSSPGAGKPPLATHFSSPHAPPRGLFPVHACPFLFSQRLTPSATVGCADRGKGVPAVEKSFVPARLVLSRGTRTKQDRDHSLLRARPTQLLESAGLPPSTTKAKQSRFKVQRRHLHTFVAGVALYFGLTGGPQAHTPARGKVAATSPRLVSDASLASLTSTSFALNSVFWSNLHPSCPAFRCLRTQTRHPACAPCRARHNKHSPAKPLQRRNPTKVPPVSGACRHRV